MLSSSRMSGSEVVLLLLWQETGAEELEVGEAADDEVEAEEAEEQVTITELSASEARLSWWHTSAVTTIVFRFMSSSLESSWSIASYLSGSLAYCFKWIGCHKHFEYEYVYPFIHFTDADW